jgi:hypothetical protein
MSFRAVFLALCTVPAVLSGQVVMRDGVKERAGIAPLAKMVGQWQGDARVQMGPGEAQVVTQHEDVVFGAGQTVLMIRGTGRLKDGNPGTIIFEAAAMIWYDSDANKLKMRAHRGEGVSMEPDVELRGDTLVWGFPMNGGLIRYTTVVTDTEWHEVGHFVREGMPPFQMMEMRLKRLK